jgi:hypothetical protein
LIALAAAILAATHPESLHTLYGAGLDQAWASGVLDKARSAGQAAAEVQQAHQAHQRPASQDSMAQDRSPHDRALWGRDFAVRGFDRDFDAFNRQVLCFAVTPAPDLPTRPAGLAGSTGLPGPGRRLGLVVEDSSAVMSRFGTSRLSELRRELACWVAVLAPGSAAQCRRLEALATASLLSRSDVQCAYRLAPIAVHGARPVVVVQLKILESVGRERFLRALWASQTGGAIAGAAQEAVDASVQEAAGLYDGLADRLRQHFARMGAGPGR